MSIGLGASTPADLLDEGCRRAVAVLRGETLVATLSGGATRSDAGQRHAQPLDVVGEVRRAFKGSDHGCIAEAIDGCRQIGSGDVELGQRSERIELCSNIAQDGHVSIVAGGSDIVVRIYVL